MKACEVPSWSGFDRDERTRSGRRLRLRTPRWEDLEALTRWIYLLAGAAEVEANLLPLSYAEANQWAGVQLSRWFQGGSLCCLAELGDQVVGEVEVVPQPAYQSHVGTLALGVLPAYRGDGIGRLLLTEALQRAPEGRLEIIRLSVFSCNLPALHLYRSLGFKVTGRIPGAVRRGDERWDEWVMVRRMGKHR